jgi:ATP-dependent Lhr-like helicase
VLDALVRHGASFLPDIQAATGLGGLAAREALRELVAAGLVTNDTVDALREVIRARPVAVRGSAGPDPARWLPAGFTPSPDRPVVQRRPNLRRLPKWKRPDLPGGATGWVGRWSLLATPGTLGPELDDEERADAVARQWLERYGVVSRDWWPRERPPVPWRAVYRELRRLELRGEVRRGYFVRGLSGAQFALPEAVERLREAASAAGAGDDGAAPFVVLATTDSANPYPVARAAEDVPPLARPRGAGALLVCRAGAVAMAAEGRGARVQVAEWLAEADVTLAARALAEHVLAGPRSTRRSRDLIVRTIDGAHAGASRHAEAFARAGYRRSGMELTYYAAL